MNTIDPKDIMVNGQPLSTILDYADLRGADFLAMVKEIPDEYLGKLYDVQQKVKAILGSCLTDEDIDL